MYIHKTKVDETYFFSFLLLSSFAQEENALPYVHQKVAFDRTPQFPGGARALQKFFEDSIRYPEPEKTKGLQGDVSAKFTVTKKGKLIDIKILNGVPYAPNLAKEAERVLQSMPRWKPATKKGKAVEAEYYLNIPFKINKVSQ